MSGIRVFQAYLCLLLALSSESRRYDVEEESVKLYGEDLKTILSRFRRTPDYLKILQDKASQLQDDFLDVSSMTMFGNFGKIPERIMEKLNVKEEERAALRINRPNMVGFLPPSLDPEKIEKIGQKNRRDNKENSEENPGVKRLDSYSKLYNPLSLTEKHQMTDLGFEMAGEIINNIIKNMEEEPRRSTVGVETEAPAEDVAEEVVADEGEPPAEEEAAPEEPPPDPEGRRTLSTRSVVFLRQRFDSPKDRFRLYGVEKTWVKKGKIRRLIPRI